MITNEDDAPDKPLFADSAQNAYLNDFLFLCLNNIHRGQCLSLLKFVSGDPESIKTQVERVYPEIEEGERGDGVPEVKVYSKELVAYMSSFLPVAPYFRSTDERINGVCDSQYSATMARLGPAGDQKFTEYLTRKMQGWLRRFPPGACDEDEAVSTPLDTSTASGFQMSDDDE